MKIKTLLFLLLAPLSLRETLSIYIPYTQGKHIAYETEEENYEEVFNFVYLDLIARGLNPSQIIFNIQPYSSDKFMKAYNYSEQLMKAL